MPWDSTFTAYLGFQTPYLALFLVLWYGAAGEQRLFRPWRTGSVGDYMFAITKAVGSALVFGTVLLALVAHQRIDSRFLLDFSVVTPMAIIGGRLIFRKGLGALQRRGYNRRRVLVVGANERAVQMAQVLGGPPPSGIRTPGIYRGRPRTRRGIGVGGPVSPGRV